MAKKMAFSAHKSYLNSFPSSLPVPLPASGKHRWLYKWR